MKHPRFRKAAMTIVGALALTSTPVHGANVRSGTSRTDTQVAAQGTAAQSAKQEGSIDSNSTPQGAARRSRVGSFVANAIESVRRFLNPDVVTEGHMADASMFIRTTLRESRFFLTAEESAAFERDVKDLIAYGTDFIEAKRAYELVEELAKTDEEALHALFLLANYRSIFWMKVDRPESAAAIARIETRLHEAGLTSLSDDGVSWRIDRGFAPAILAAPGARPLLHKLSKSKAQSSSAEDKP